MSRHANSNRIESGDKFGSRHLKPVEIGAIGSIGDCRASSIAANLVCTGAPPEGAPRDDESADADLRCDSNEFIYSGVNDGVC